jgi:hypothetical protein
MCKFFSYNAGLRVSSGRDGMVIVKVGDAKMIKNFIGSSQ